MLQGDRRHAGTPADGVIARRQIAEVLVGSLTSPAATGKTFELVAEQGQAQPDLEPLFDALDAVHDLDNLLFASEPEHVRREYARMQQSSHS